MSKQIENSPKTKNDSSPLSNVSNAEEIAERAYHIWLERGCPEATCMENWLQAETELRKA